MLYFSGPANQGVVPGRLIRGEVGERVKEGGRATSRLQSLEYKSAYNVIKHQTRGGTHPF